MTFECQAPVQSRERHTASKRACDSGVCECLISTNEMKKSQNKQQTQNKQQIVGRRDQTERAQMQQATPSSKQSDDNIHQRQTQLTCRSIWLAVAICLLAIGVASQHLASLWKQNGCNERGVCSLPASPLCFQVGGIWGSRAKCANQDSADASLDHHLCRARHRTPTVAVALS